MINVQAIASLAILKVNNDQGFDYLDLFTPVVAYAGGSTKDDFVSLEFIKSNLLSEFSLDIPRTTLKTICKRCGRQGYFKPKENVYYINRDKIDSLDFKNKIDAFTRDVNRIINNLCLYANNKFPVDWNPSDAESSFLEFLNEFDFHVIKRSKAVFSKTIRRVKGSKYIIASYIYDSLECDTDTIEIIETIAKGNMLANTVYFDYSTLQKKIVNTEFYIDTRIMLRALDYSRDESKHAAQEFFNIMKSYKFKLLCFDHTLREMEQILLTVASKLRGPGGLRNIERPISDAIIRRKLSASDLTLQAEKLVDKINRLGVHVVEVPPYTTPDQMDESALERSLIKEFPDQSIQARLNDIKSVTALYRMRYNKRPKYIEDANAIFITVHNTLISCVEQQHNEVLFGEVPLLVNANSLVDYLWVKNPMKSPDVPRKRILANIKIALGPSNAVWKKYINEIDKLLESDEVEEDDYLLMRDIEARKMLARKTVNEPDLYVDGTPSEILKNVKDNLVETERAKSNDALRRVEKMEDKLDTVVQQKEMFIKEIGGLVRILVAITLMIVIVVVIAFTNVVQSVILKIIADVLIILYTLVVEVMQKSPFGGVLSILQRRVESWLQRKLGE